MTSMSDDNGTVVLHWNEVSQSWDPVRWSEWLQFRAIDVDFRPLQNVGPGDHYFVVCIVDTERTLFNIIPHRYRIDTDRHITNHRFDDLTDAELEFVGQWQVAREIPTGADAEMFDALRNRIWRSHLPPKSAATILIQNLPGFPATDVNRPALSFLREFGIVSSAKPSSAMH